MLVFHVKVKKKNKGTKTFKPIIQIIQVLFNCIHKSTIICKRKRKKIIIKMSSAPSLVPSVVGDKPHFHHSFHSAYGPDDLSYFGYFSGMILIIVLVILPLLLMGFRAKNVFRRGGGGTGSGIPTNLDGSGGGANWYS